MSQLTLNPTTPHRSQFGFFRLWEQLWFLRFDPSALGAFRVSLGFLMLVYFVAFYPNWERFYSPRGVLSLHEIDPARTHQDRLSVFYWTENSMPVMAWWWAGFGSTALFTVGWHTRIATVSLFVLINSMAHRNRMAVNGEDLIFRMLLFYGCFAPLSQTLSVDQWLKSRRNPGRTEELPVVWPVRLMQFNICLIYIISLPNKLVDDAAWLDGTAIYLAMTNDVWSRFPWPQLFYGGILSPLFTYGTIVVEGLFPILVWMRSTRWVALAAITSLHLGIAICLQNVTFFTLSMVCSFWVLVPGEAIRNAMLKLSNLPRASGKSPGPQEGQVLG